MSTWEEPDPAEVLALRRDADWAALRTRYSNFLPTPYERCLEVARQGGARTAVVETRYIDLDYRSEYSAFFSKTFGEVPDSAQRLHFFTAELDGDSIADLPSDAGYIGYVVIRPSTLGRVGRAMLRPPPDMVDHIQCATTERVSFFGQYLEVTGVPFAQQDTQFGRCAHVAAWICHYSAVLRGDASRRPMADFSLQADPSVAEGRPLPSQGLTGLQLSNLLRDFGLPPIAYRMGQLPESGQEPPVPDHGDDDDPGSWDTRVVAVVCRFLNSRYPVLVGTRNHAFVLVGYRRESRVRPGDWISFIRHDDQRGPYLTVVNVLDDVDSATGHHYGPWVILLAPVPEKLWLLPEAAERVGRSLLRALDNRQGSGALGELDRRGGLTYRTYAIPSSEFKAGATRRRLGAEALREYRLARLPRMVWVVEAVDRARRRRGAPCVVGEVVFDSTSSDFTPQALIVRVPGTMLVVQTNGNVRMPLPAGTRASRSAAVAEP